MVITFPVAPSADLGNMRMLSTKAEFDAALAASHGKLLVIDFTASWCGPCQRIAPVFEALSAEYPQASFAKVDVDENQETAQECKVSAMPTFKGYREKREVFSVRGADEATLRAQIAAHAGSKFQGQGQRLGGAADMGVANAMSEREKRLAALEKRGLAPGVGGSGGGGSGGSGGAGGVGGSYLDQLGRRGGKEGAAASDRSRRGCRGGRGRQGLALQTGRRRRSSGDRRKVKAAAEPKARSCQGQGGGGCEGGGGRGGKGGEQCDRKRRADRHW